MRGMGASRDGIIQLSESLALNKTISLVSVDLSNNPIEDRGIVCSSFVLPFLPLLPFLSQYPPNLNLGEFCGVLATHNAQRDVPELFWVHDWIQGHRGFGCWLLYEPSPILYTQVISSPHSLLYFCFVFLLDLILFHLI